MTRIFMPACRRQRSSRINHSTMEMLHKEITDIILHAFYRVYNELGFGFLEKVYQNALLIELRKQGLQAEPQKRIKVYYLTSEVGEYFADFIVNDSVILELKAA
ncbi:MAG TPA: GxxExxY protein, partial [Bacteroidales bacterium]|nr:GxxExxY protein [Bacteroidales bacterium]